MNYEIRNFAPSIENRSLLEILGEQEALVLCKVPRTSAKPPHLQRKAVGSFSSPHNIQPGET